MHRTVNHLLLTDDIWFARFAEGRSLRLPLDTELHTDRIEVCQALVRAVARWGPWLATLAPERFDGELAYTRNNGDAVRIPFAPALGHVFNHATHHRGQLSAALTAMAPARPRARLGLSAATGSEILMSQSFTKLKLSIDGAIARIWLNQPEVRNAFNDIVIAELGAAFAEAGAAPRSGHRARRPTARRSAPAPT